MIIETRFIFFYFFISMLKIFFFKKRMMLHAFFFWWNEQKYRNIKENFKFNFPSRRALTTKKLEVDQTQGRIHVRLGGQLPSGFWIIVFLDNAFGNLFPSPEIFFAPPKLSVYFYWEKIFNIVHNKIIMQRCQNIKFSRGKFSLSTCLSIILLLLCCYF
jgi:hypothetical protein